MKRYQYPAIDDATRIRALQIPPEHNQACAIWFLDPVIQPLPYLISSIRMGRGYECQRFLMETDGWIVVQAAQGETNMMLVFESLLKFENQNKRFISLEL